MRGTIIRLTGALTVLSLASPGHARATWDAQIRAVDARFRHAMIAGDAAGIDRTLADDAKIIHGGNGFIQTKQELIARFRTWHFTRYDRSPILSKAGGGLAVLVSTTHKVERGKDTTTSTTEVFILRSGRWQIYVLQNTDHAAG